jgi:hypothetical protein
MQHICRRYQNSVVTPLFEPRSIWPLLLVSFAIGAVSALAMLPIGLIDGAGPFWSFPSGMMGGASNDIAQVLVGYLYFVKSPWTLPVLQAPLLGPETGTNVFWLDVIPWVALAGKAVFKATGALINPYGLYAFACFSLPGTGMTAVLATTGQRNLAAAISSSVLAGATPFLLWRWGHLALNSHFLILFSLAFYVWTVRHAPTWWVQSEWAGFLGFALLTNVYLSVMVSGLWMAAVVQMRLDRAITTRHAAAQAVAVLSVILCLMLVTGMLSRDLASAGNGGFGFYSMNLLSPVVPQMSGVFGPSARMIVGTPGQYEGFAYLGAGVLLLLCANARYLGSWIVHNWRAHAALASVLLGFFLFALSHKVYAGTQLLLEVPLPGWITYALGTFRGSGRFFWPVGYALIASAVLSTCRNYSPRHAATLLSVAALLQWADAGPLRSALIQSTAHSVSPALDRGDLAIQVARSTKVMVFPTYHCVDVVMRHDALSAEMHDFLLQANLEVMLATARAGVPVNSVYTARNLTDCNAEQASQHSPLRTGTLYVYLTEFIPSAEQMGGIEPAKTCDADHRAHFCRRLQ